MRIALLYPRWSTAQDKSITVFSKKAGRFPPLGLALLGAYAQMYGHKVLLIDGEIEDLSLEEMIKKTIEFQPDLIGFTASTPFFHVVVKAAQWLKGWMPEVPILIGGPHITILREKAFLPCFDYGFIGESEVSFVNFLMKYPYVSRVKGIIMRTGGKIIYTGDAKIIENLDVLPVPAYDQLKMGKYKMGTLQGVKPFFPIQTQRGCPFDCIFCNVDLNKKKVRYHSPEYVVHIISMIQRHYGINHFIFIDDTLTLNRKHIIEICEKIIEKKLDITFEGGTRTNMIDLELMALMAKAGCIRLGFGLESVDENIRTIMRKEIPLQSYIEANIAANKFSVETQNACIIGMPGETRETIKKTMSFLRDNHDIRQANVSIAVPYPGTRLYEMAKNNEYGLKLIEKDFSKFQRYNNAVMQVGNLSPSDLIDLQNQAFASIYIAPWRWISVIRKSGLMGFFLTWKRILKCLIRGQWELLFVDPSYWRK